MMQPIPGGFDNARLIERGLQARMTRLGAGFVETNFQELVKPFVSCYIAPLSCKKYIAQTRGVITFKF